MASYNFRLISVGLFTIYLVFAGMGCWTARQTVELHEEHFIEAVDENSATSGHNNLTDRLATSGPFLHKFHTAYPRYEQYLELVFELPVDYYNRRNKDHIFSILHWALVRHFLFNAIILYIPLSIFIIGCIGKFLEQKRLDLIKFPLFLLSFFCFILFRSNSTRQKR